MEKLKVFKFGIINQNNCSDNIFEFYVSVKLQKILDSYNFTQINLYQSIHKRHNALKIVF